MSRTEPRERRFELRVVPRTSESFGMALWDVTSSGAEKKTGPIVQIWGDPFRLVLDVVLETLRKAGHRTGDLRRNREAPFALREEDAVRLGLLFLAVKPLRKLARIDLIRDQIWQMGPEEIYYWFSKATAGSGSGRRAQRALRFLMADG